MDTTKLDPQSRWEMRLIAVETAIEQFKQAHTGLERLGELEARIKILEEARLRQISFNTEVSNRLAKLEKPVEIKKPEVKEIKFKWPWQK